ncbi:hypothetical protein GC096_26000 [Paenibacillus sp. LMG 31461]|uniref:Uncharacterized protein n=1 Tax=Paenibacillus plantarum TaxID=2654975 RepID=A0ABX1XHM1_9BACL|nr:hypothetical protein [Paenibacillus plantarum]NOU67501.1 hypothetical protein [Paenibacillus plantarum]
MKELSKKKDVWDQANLKIEKFLGVNLNSSNESFNVSTGEDSKLLGFVRNSSTIIMQRKFDTFLNGFIKDGVTVEDQLEELIDFIDNEAKAEFIAETFSKIILSKSTQACLILGSMLGTLIKSKADIEYKYLVCVNVLMNLYDIDIINFKFVYLYINNSSSRRKTAILEGKKFNVYCDANDLELSSVFLTIDKCVSNQILNKYNEVSLNMDSNDIDSSDADVDEYFKITSPGELLYEQICKCNL